MAVSAIQNNKDNTPKMGYITSILTGSAVGYSLKYLLPVAKHEKNDENYKNALKAIRAEIKEERKDFLNSIRNSTEKTPAEDTFIKMIDNKELKASKINALPNSQKSDVKILITKINLRAKELFHQRQKTINATVKDIRPTMPFVTTGAVIALTTAFTYNVLHQVASEKIEK